MLRKRVRVLGGDLELTVRAVGISKIYRLACHLLTGQSEFAQLGGDTLTSLRRRLGARGFRELEAKHWGPAGRALAAVSPDRQRLRDLLATTHREMDDTTWRAVTERLPLPQRELWADEVDATSEHMEAVARRWWHDFG